MNKTSIEWVKNPDGSQGYTWNPITGCLNHENGLCKGGGFPCYAYKLAHGRLRERYLANDNIAMLNRHNFVEYRLHHPKPTPARQDPFYPRFWPGRLAILQRGIDSLDYESYIRRKPIGIFPCDMGDLSGIGVPEEWTADIMLAIRADPLDRFYLLTKQPQNLIKFSPFPDNCWVGVTATDHLMFAHAYYHLADIEAKIKYISIEPLLNWYNRSGVTQAFINQAKQLGAGWLIIGAQTKPYRPPKIECVQEIVEAADKAGIPVFLKENLAPIIPPEKPFRYFESYHPSESAILNDESGTWKLRQEMPDGE